MMEAKVHSIYDEIYELSPKSLRDLCLATIVEHIEVLTTFKPMNSDEKVGKKLSFIQNIDIPCRFAECLLEELAKREAISNDTLSIFTRSLFNLKVVKLPKINMNFAGLELVNFSSFRLKQLHLGCTKDAIHLWNIKKLKASFLDSCDSLTTLKVKLYPSVSLSSGTMFDFFVLFRNLMTLHYDSPIAGNDSNFTNNNWGMLLSKCTQLKMLYFNINGSPREVELDSSLFQKCCNLQSLTLRSVFKSERALQSVNCIQYFSQINTLRCLDFSVDVDPEDQPQPIQFLGIGHVEMESHGIVFGRYVETFLKMSSNKLPLLESFDISGVFHVKDRDIQNFVDSHKNLIFLGLCMIRSRFCLSKDVAKEYTHIKISGCNIEDQIVTSLLKYPNRPTYMREVLKGLFQVSSTWQKRRPFIVEKVLNIMKKFQSFHKIMLAATACIFHLSKEQEHIDNELNAVMLSEIAVVTARILSTYITNLQMVKNCLLIICTDRILHNAKFDRVSMCKICLNCMSHYSESVDGHVTRMAVAIISILACRISSEETASLVAEKEMKLLLDIVQIRIDNRQIDSTLKFNLSALWNITDESPVASKLFFDLNGISKYVKMLEVFANDTQIETRVLGLLNNIAEVKFLQEVLILNEELINRVKALMASTTKAVSYFACGIIANLCLSWDIPHTCLSTQMKSEVIDELQKAIDNFGVLQQEIVTYRSFKPFYELLECHERPQVQNWAVWAIHHVCTLNAPHYKQIMNNRCLELLDNVSVRTCEDIQNQILEIHKALDEYTDIKMDVE